jgi:hypothetical protein
MTVEIELKGRKKEVLPSVTVALRPVEEADPKKEGENAAKEKRIREHNPTFQCREQFEAVTKAITKEILSAANFVGGCRDFSEEDRLDLASAVYTKALEAFEQVPCDRGRKSYLSQMVRWQAADMIRFRRLHVVIDPKNDHIRGLARLKKYVECADTLLTMAGGREAEQWT